jgi:hypothetical protein
VTTLRHYMRGRSAIVLLIPLGLTFPTAALAQAVPKIGTCPSGYYTSGGACVPHSSNLRPALPKIGTCPSGYYTSGDYCLGYEKARHAIPNTGSCPSGYYASGAYCLSYR